MLNLYQNIPSHIDPIAVAVDSFSIRWYALSYIAGFMVVYFVLMWRVKGGEFTERIMNDVPMGISLEQKLRIKDEKKIENPSIILDFLIIAFFSALVGGRIGYVLLYNLPYFIKNPLAIISPYVDGNFVGIYGMSYHGALVGILLGSYVFLRIKKISVQGGFWQWADFMIPAVPLGYFFGRLGNFLNGELYGRVTTSPLGMYFSAGTLRHPSQLYEAFLEGLVLFVILWAIRNKKMISGALFSIYLIGYGAVRIFSEQFRQPDPQIGFLLSYFTLGQLLSFGMIIAGVFILLFQKNRKKSIL